MTQKGRDPSTPELVRIRAPVSPLRMTGTSYWTAVITARMCHPLAPSCNLYFLLTRRTKDGQDGGPSAIAEGLPFAFGENTHRYAGDHVSRNGNLNRSACAGSYDLQDTIRLNSS